MTRHSRSLGISLLFHLLLIGVLFFSYDANFLKKDKHTEKLLCMKLQCVAETPIPIQKNFIPQKTHKLEAVKKHKIHKKVVKKRVVHKVKSKPKPKVLAEVKQSTPVIEKEIKVKKSETTAVVKKSIPKPEEVSKKIPQKTAEEIYVDENLKKIVTLLQENLYYPRRARRRGLEGDVVVKFKLSQNAVVSSIEVVSSQSDILSRGAIKTIENLSTIFPKPKEELLLKVPISYKLKR